MESDCQIRYIITINALKEGWDCPFAYILASLANRTSTIDVEQILGRILRRPFTKNFSNELLNMSYVFTSSADFRQTLDKIVIGLNAAGFSEHEYRAITDSALEHALEQTPTHETLNLFDTPASARLPCRYGCPCCPSQSPPSGWVPKDLCLSNPGIQSHRVSG